MVFLLKRVYLVETESYDNEMKQKREEAIQSQSLTGEIVDYRLARAF